YLGDGELPGAQIDLLLDRDDDIVSLFEIKFTYDPFIITKSYSNSLRNKLSIFKSVNKIKKGVMLTLITTHPAIQNKYYDELVSNEIIMDDLFVE
ncbi:MAG: ATPase, partial [Bacteroidota bacterium]